jgi:hypothetical protein
MMARLLFLIVFFSSQSHAGITDFLSGSSFSSKTVTGNQTLVVKNSSGSLHAVVIGNASTGGEIKVYDGTSASGLLILDLLAGTPSGGLLSGSGNPPAHYIGPLELTFSTGLTVVTSNGTTNNPNLFTVVYQ